MAVYQATVGMWGTNGVVLQYAIPASHGLEQKEAPLTARPTMGLQFGSPEGKERYFSDAELLWTGRMQEDGAEAGEPDLAGGGRSAPGESLQ